jgi:carbohydrate diacid regulator
MISNQVLESTLEGLKTISRVDMCIMDTEGIVVASTLEHAEDFRDSVISFKNSPAESQVISGYQFFKVFDDLQLEYILIANGSTDDVYMIAKMAAFQIQTLIVAYKERFDKDNFIKNLLLDNLLLVDIYNRAKKLHIESEARRVVFILELDGERENSSLELVRGVIEARQGDFVTAVDEKSVIVVRELISGEGAVEMDATAKAILAALPQDRRGEALVSYGTVVRELKEVSRSYKEARMALNVGKIFYSQERIHMYRKLGIGRLIYQLPENLCRLFLKEVFTKQQPETFDEETLTTIKMFFGNSLNVSETARQLFVHRNTLVYRLEKLSRSTGLDIRSFDDAVTFKIALMVESYLKYMEKHPS